MQKFMGRKLTTGRRPHRRGGRWIGRPRLASPRQVQSHKSRDTARGSYNWDLYI
jgi:hypothetical protein